MARIKLTIDDTEIQKALDKLVKASNDLSVPMEKLVNTYYAALQYTTKSRWNTMASTE